MTSSKLAMTALVVCLLLMPFSDAGNAASRARKYAPSGASGETTATKVDKDGRPVEIVKKDQSGKVVERRTLEYDNQGNSVATTRGPDGKVAGTESRDKSGKLLGSTSVQYSSDNVITSTKDVQGRVTASSTVDKGGRLVSESAVTYDKAGNALTITTTKNKDGTVTVESRNAAGHREVIVRHSDGREISSRAWQGSSSGSTSTTPYRESITTYDKQGNSTTTTSYPGGNKETVNRDKSGKFVSSTSVQYSGDIVITSSKDAHGLNNFSRTVDKSGRLVAEVTYDQGGNAISYHKIEKDKSGSTFETTFKEGKSSAVTRGPDGKILSEVTIPDRIANETLLAHQDPSRKSKAEFDLKRYDINALKPGETPTRPSLQDMVVPSHIQGVANLMGISVPAPPSADRWADARFGTIFSHLAQAQDQGAGGSTLYHGGLLNGSGLLKTESMSGMSAFVKDKIGGSSTESGAMSASDILSRVASGKRSLTGFPELPTIRQDSQGNSIATTRHPDGSKTAIKQDRDGRILSWQELAPNGKLVSNSVTTYDSWGNGQRRTTGPDGKLTLSETLDHLGRQLTVTKLDLQGKVVASRNWKYLPDGGAEAVTHAAGNTETVSYNAKGNLTSQSRRDSAGKVWGTDVFTYGATDQMTSHVKTTPSGTQISDYATGGNLTSRVSKDSAGKVLMSEKWTYDRAGKVANYESTGSLLSSQLMKNSSGTSIMGKSITYLPDGGSIATTKGPNGQITGTVVTDKNGKPTKTTVLTYGKDGKLSSTETVTFNDKGQVASHTKTQADGKTVSVAATAPSGAKPSTPTMTKPATPVGGSVVPGKLPASGPGQATTPKTGSTAATKAIDLKAPSFADKTTTPTTTSPASTTTGKPPTDATKLGGTATVKPSVTPATTGAQSAKVQPSTTTVKQTTSASTTTSTKTTTDPKASLKPAEFGVKKDSGTGQTAKVQPSATTTAKQSTSTSTTTTVKSGVAPVSTSAHSAKVQPSSATVKQTTPTSTTTTKSSGTKAQTAAETATQKTTTQPVQTTPVVQPVRPPVATPGRK
ncbi:MAG: hypothetical protein AB1473_14195 [Thermodesulfobacteriota bacterium]